jgi:hypothetical protein
MKFKFFSLKPSPGSLSVNMGRHDNSGGKSVSGEDEALFNSDSRILESGTGIWEADHEILDETGIQELDEIRAEILGNNLDEDAKRLINDWENAKKGGDYKEAVWEYVSDSLNVIESNLNYDHVINQDRIT